MTTTDRVWLLLLEAQAIAEQTPERARRLWAEARSVMTEADGG